MKSKGVLIILLGVMCFQVQAQKLKTKSDSLAYAVGLDLVEKLKREGFDDVDEDVLTMAIVDVLNKKEPKIDKVTASMMYRNAVRDRKERVKEEMKAEGEAFLEEISKKKGVKSLPKGLYYEVLTEGTGPKPEKGGDVTIHYEGKLIDGTVFDSSYDRGQPNTFNLKRLIKGWQVALPEMPVGSKWRIYIPYNMAYGERGAGQKIKPYSALIFDIELFGI